MAGPLPQEARRRTNAPVIPTTRLPAGGHTGPTPKLPPTAKLGNAGRAWWKWAWSTPQAAAWSLGHEGVVARRASLEDDLRFVEDVDGLDLLDLVDADGREIRQAVQRVCALVTGRLGICREMRELDDRLGLTPKAMAQLRWTIDKGEGSAEGQAAPSAPNVVTPERWQRTAAG